MKLMAGCRAAAAIRRPGIVSAVVIGTLALAPTAGAGGSDPYLIADINPGAGDSEPNELTGVGDEAFFVAGDPPTGPGLWQSDGTADGTTLVVSRIALDAATFSALGRSTPILLDIAGASTVEGYYGEIYAYGASSVTFKYRLPGPAPLTVKASPGFTVLDIVEAFNWVLGEYVTVEWNTDIATRGLVSASGEMVLRASREEASRSFDESLQLDRFALTWSTS